MLKIYLWASVILICDLKLIFFELFLFEDWIVYIQGWLAVNIFLNIFTQIVKYFSLFIFAIWVILQINVLWVLRCVWVRTFLINLARINISMPEIKSWGAYFRSLGFSINNRFFSRSRLFSIKWHINVWFLPLT